MSLPLPLVLWLLPDPDPDPLLLPESEVDAPLGELGTWTPRGFCETHDDSAAFAAKLLAVDARRVAFPPKSQDVAARSCS